jgi:hypothetical protein
MLFANAAIRDIDREEVEKKAELGDFVNPSAKSIFFSADTCLKTLQVGETSIYAKVGPTVGTMKWSKTLLAHCSCCHCCSSCSCHGISSELAFQLRFSYARRLSASEKPHAVIGQRTFAAPVQVAHIHPLWWRSCTQWS